MAKAQIEVLYQGSGSWNLRLGEKTVASGHIPNKVPTARRAVIIAGQIRKYADEAEFKNRSPLRGRTLSRGSIIQIEVDEKTIVNLKNFWNLE